MSLADTSSVQEWGKTTLTVKAEAEDAVRGENRRHPSLRTPGEGDQRPGLQLTVFADGQHSDRYLVDVPP